MNKQLFSTGFVWLTYVLAMFPILTFGLRSVITIAWIVLGILNAVINYKNEFNIKRKYLIFLLISIFPFIYLGMTLIYSEHYTYGVKRLVRMLPFFVFPIVFYLNKTKFDKKLINQILWVFSISVSCFVFYQIFFSLFNFDFLLGELSNREIIRNKLSNQDLLNPDIVSGIKTRRFRNFIIALVDTHFTYQGLWIAFTVFFISKQGLRVLKRTKIPGLLLLFNSLVLIIWMFVISSRMPIIAMIVAFLYTKFTITEIKIKTKVIAVLLAVLFLITGYFAFTPFRVRVDQILDTNFEMPSETKDSYNYDSVNVRNGIYTCALYLCGENPLFGVGVGDSQSKLNECYNDKIGAKIYNWQDYNTHNQYLFFLVSSGIIGLFLFLILMFTHWKMAVFYKSEIYLYFIVIICVISLTENILSRSDGVMFFSFFSSLFLFNLKGINDRN